jgi:uncharacterized sulfatase
MKHFINYSFLLALLVGVPAATIFAEAESKPNIVVIISDDQGFGDYGFMGHEVIQTPHLDRLADESLLFTRGYVTTALCSPSLATMVTGLYPHQHGTTGNDPVKGQHRQDWIKLFRQQPQLPALLGEAGYLSFHTGKYWHGNPEVSGFTDSMGATQRHGSKASLGIGRDGMQPIYDFIAKAQDAEKPFLVWYAPFLPHTPHNPPERLLAKYRGKAANLQQAKYFAMVDWLDETCGELLGHLDKKNLTDNTLVFYICDNGWPGSAKGTPNEQGVRTPIMIKWPEHVQPQKNDTNLASNLDLAPTLLAACGLKPTPEMPGINLLDAAALSSRTTLFADNYAHDMARADKPEDSLRARSCISKDWKLTVWQNPQPDLPIAGWQTPASEEEVELFHLKEDPLEKNNVAAQHPDKVSEMKTRLNKWWNP